MKHKAQGLDLLLKDLEFHCKKTEYLKSKIKEVMYTKIGFLREYEQLKIQPIEAAKDYSGLLN